MKQAKPLLLVILLMAVNCAYATTYGILPQDLNSRMRSLVGSSTNPLDWDTKIWEISFVTNSSSTSGTQISDGEYPVYMSCNDNKSVITFNTAASAYMAYGGDMFSCFTNLRKISNLGCIDTQDVTNMQRMFYYCKNLTSVDVGNFNTENVTSMANMFYQCVNLTSLDLSNFNTRNVTNMAGMFAYCEHLKSLNVSNFNTRNVTTMRAMFQYCENLTSLDLSNFRTQNVTDMEYMFQYCSRLEALSLSNFNTEKVTNMNYMFGSCRYLSSLTLSSKFVLDNVKNKSYMFSNVATLSKSCTIVCSQTVKEAIQYRLDDPEYFTWDLFNVIQLIDGNEYNNTQNENGDITYTRNFTNTNWNALYVPMSINVEDYAGELDFAEIYAFCAMKDTNWDGVVDANDENFLYVSPMKTGCTKPNVPYMIRPKEAKNYEINSADNVLYAKAEGKVEFSTSHDNFTVTGLNEPFTVTAGDNNYYVSASGSLDYRTTGSTNVKPNRWVMHRDSKEYGGGTLTESAAKGSYRIVAIGEDIDEATAIEIIKMQNAGKTANSGIYTIDGRKMNGEKSLPAGIYIKNGKKFIMK